MAEREAFTPQHAVTYETTEAGRRIVAAQTVTKEADECADERKAAPASAPATAKQADPDPKPAASVAPPKPATDTKA